MDDGYWSKLNAIFILHLEFSFNLEYQFLCISVSAARYLQTYCCQEDCSVLIIISQF